MMTTFSACVELAIVSGFTTFLPKYIETQFNLSPSSASGLTGEFFSFYFVLFYK